MLAVDCIISDRTLLLIGCAILLCSTLCPLRVPHRPHNPTPRSTRLKQTIVRVRLREKLVLRASTRRVANLWEQILVNNGLIATTEAERAHMAAIEASLRKTA